MIKDRQIETRISNADLAAVPTDAGVDAVLANGLTLIFSEGRSYSMGYENADPAKRWSALEYDCFVFVEANGYPDEWSGDPAKIMIRGTCDDGTTLEVRGEGYVGKDENGSIGISFDGPPDMRMSEDWSDSDTTNEDGLRLRAAIARSLTGKRNSHPIDLV